MKRPLFRVGLFYIGGILIAGIIPVAPFWLLAAALSMTAIALFWARARPILLSALILLTGWTNQTLRTAIISPNDLRRVLGNEPQLATVRGVLSETPSRRVFEQDEKPSWRTMAKIQVSTLRIDKQEWRQATGRLAVTTPEELTNFFAGQTVEIMGVARLPRSAVAEGTFDYRSYLKQLGIYYQLQAGSEQDWRVVSSPAAAPLADRFRAWARQALALGLPAEDEALRLEWALTLGWKTALTEEVAEPFVRAATYHIFAVDGLRMAIIFGIFFGLFRAVGLPRAFCGAILIPLIWFYAALTGWPASAIRATIMLTVLIVGWVLNRPTDLINSLFAAALIILLWQPQQLYQAGFQLSFLVVLCIILILSPLHDLWERLTAPDPLLPVHLRRRWPAVVRVPARFVGATTATSFAAWIGALPLVAYYFNIVTPVSTPANLVAVPLCALVLVSNLASLLCAGWFPFVAEIFNHAGWFLMESIRVSSEWFTHWPRAYFYVRAPSFLTSGLYYSILLALLTGWIFKPKYRLWKISALALALFFWGWQFWSERAKTRLHILPVSGGFAIYCDAPGTKDDLLIDCGTTNGVQFTTKAFLRAQGVNRLPRLALTHGDLHHVGGAEMLDHLFSIREVCVSPIRFRSAAYRTVVADLRRIPGKVRTVSRSDQLGQWTVLHPDSSDRFPQADDNALVLSTVLDSTRVLLLSDLGRPGQEALLERTPDLRADILVTGLPVRTEAVEEVLLERTQARVLIVADSEYPASERASAALRQRLAKKDITVLYTRFTGAVTFEFSKSDWELNTMSGMKIRGRDYAMQKAGAEK